MDISKRRLFDENYQQSLLTVTGNMPVVDIIEQMSHAQTSYALVLKQQELVGIFTERDAVRAIANRTLFENITVAEAMTQPVITISKADAEDIAIVLQKFHQHGIRHLPVMDNGELLGIVTQTSVLRVLESIRVNFAFETLQQTIDAKRAVSSLADITARKQTELEIIKSRDLLEVMYNESADAIFLVDAETLITTDCNQRAVELFEASSKAEIINIEGQALQKQQFSSDELSAIVAEINQRRVWSQELQYVTKKNNEFWGNIAVKQITVADQVMNLVRIADISDRKRAEQMLELQAVITRNMAEGICLVRATDGIIVYANLKFEKMFGYDSGELTGQHVSIVNYEDENMTAEEVNQAIRAAVLQQGEATYEVHNVKKDGTPFWCRATTSVFKHPEYGIVLVAVQQDITEHKQAEEKIQRSLKEKEVLLKEIHHRVKNNLGIVSSLLQMQCRRTQDLQVTPILLDSQNRIASIALVHEKLYRSEDLTNINFAQYIPDLVTHLFDSYNIRSSHIKLHFQVEDVGLDIESAIPCGLIVNELISNALKYAFPNKQTGEIIVKLYEDEHHLILIVRDNGVGLPVEFDKKKTKTLGINLIQGLVKQLRGSIEINSQQGTEFKITFKKSRDIP
ncbi:hypothetical protein WA1_23390 [Scytonema hofmannii PCC 7110]|uniref:histidine kinase n=1 Tax=Scytonema hofmannii PCC 7110 TaxID=128403 RepID=A0A139X8N4_9CYAN|nr:histidine kinase dimerization/phosphoacceptor domain -containing protein [Scytonema hofmannii]KYC41064.1 hypothetical protein WA1_23390 [Scytonema hofmannii PCC 7110]